jgi:hypothetical protein
MVMIRQFRLPVKRKVCLALGITWCFVVFALVVHSKAKCVPRRLDTVVDLEFTPVPLNSIHVIVNVSQKALTPRARELCAVESAAKHNPKTSVVLHMISPRLYNNRMVRAVKAAYRNVVYRRFDLAEALEGTPLEEWYVVWSRFSYVVCLFEKEGSCLPRVHH